MTDLGVLIGARLRELRLEAEMTQEQIARALRSHRPIINRIESGTHVLSLHTLYAYAKALDIDPRVVLVVVEPEWRAAFGWSPEEVERWWPRGRGRRMKVPCVPTDEKSSADSAPAGSGFDAPAASTWTSSSPRMSGPRRMVARCEGSSSARRAPSASRRRIGRGSRSA